MPETSKAKAAGPTADEIAKKASRGEDVSAYFTNKFTVVRPVKQSKKQTTRTPSRP
jgi:hypothetical protein